MSSTRHPYHPQCGCATCSRHELSDERADVLAGALHRSGHVLSEALGELTDEQLGLMAGHIADGNDAAAAEILRIAVADYLSQLISGRMDDVDCSRIEAVQHYLAVYEAKPAPVAAMPWRVAA
ncbi:MULTISPECIES: hypothetical protein [Xanthomonas]|uniref:hypothetical protein n=1 Tax=Xanthomonas TaxID=338 RepID=UPI001ADB324D|nr:hypothetical protein [Xanthomonas phaseoli]MBO9766483.1 hypothetical protein [Xanthomonas phaseoli pv. dieffenbachiae]MBO9776172.1 hypothetical protein [Xanthomonas phaseoli pv. dieffenbachiae]MBO9778229.1 hypothetical protein [Xanthomonas phaseoli pv. dieffenbachiae]MBO9795382.1 hypothetical protein [Xanthomonas phaseoli pv. dieffenbachiae]MBO9801423.1 hypothetical protein [Xanthomonas phaseoli pv. dieffenbachiae]